jgi:hypothetical protein
VLDIERTAVAAHYVIASAEPGKLGHVKLNRILWFADLEQYRRAGQSMTGLTQYSRKPQGPLATQISQAVGWLGREGRAREQSAAVDGYVRRVMISLRAPDTAALGKAQTAILDHMIDVIAPLSAAQLLDLTRADPLWQEIPPDGAMVVATGAIIAKAPRLRNFDSAPARFLIAAE